MNTTFNLNYGSLTAQAGGAVQYNAATVNGGYLRGPGSHATLPGTANNFNGVTTYNSTLFQQNGADSFTNFTNGGQLTNNAVMTWNGGVNAGSGQFNVNAASNVQDWTNYGVVTVASGGTLNNAVSDMVCGGGGQITIDLDGQLNANSDGSGSSLDLRGALLVNNGTVTGATNVYYGSMAQGSGVYGPVNVYNGGTFKPGNSPGSVTTGSATWNPAGEYEVEIDDATGGGDELESVDHQRNPQSGGRHDAQQQVRIGRGLVWRHADRCFRPFAGLCVADSLRQRRDRGLQSGRDCDRRERICQLVERRLLQRCPKRKQPGAGVHRARTRQHRAARRRCHRACRLWLLAAKEKTRFGSFRHGTNRLRARPIGHVVLPSPSSVLPAGKCRDDNDRRCDSALVGRKFGQRPNVPNAARRSPAPAGHIRVQIPMPVWCSTDRPSTGTTEGGGAYNDGTVFSLPVSGGTSTILASFNGNNGSGPNGGLILNGSTLYGTTQVGGASGDGTVFSLPLSGGSPTVLTSFNSANGQWPEGGLTLSGSTIYGITNRGVLYGQGVAEGYGTVFSLPAGGGNPTTLLSFSGSNGEWPSGGVTLLGSTLYGSAMSAAPAAATALFSPSRQAAAVARSVLIRRHRREH